MGRALQMLFSAELSRIKPSTICSCYQVFNRVNIFREKKSFVVLLPPPKCILILWHAVHFASLLKSLDSYVLFLMNALIGLVSSVNTSVGLCSSAGTHVSSPPLSCWDLFNYYLISFMFSLRSVVFLPCFVLHLQWALIRSISCKVFIFKPAAFSHCHTLSFISHKTYAKSLEAGSNAMN